MHKLSSHESSLSEKLKDVDIQQEILSFSSLFPNPTPSTSELTAITSHSRERKPRKSRKTNEISPSLFRPPVLASDRLQCWSTPHSISFRDSLSSAIPSSHLSRLFEVMSFSLDQNTRNGYGAGLLRFTQFCDSLNIPEEQRMPASEVLLSSFIASAAGKVATTTVDNWLAGLHFWHTINAAEWHGNDMLAQTRKGVRKLVPISSKRAKRPPVTIEHLYALRKGLDLTNAFDIAVWALACIAFWSCCRLGELTIPSVNLFDADKHVTRSSPLSFNQTASGVDFATCHIPWTKTTQHEGADISITARDDPSCPIRVLQHHLRSNSSIPSSAPLFAFETKNGGWAPMTKSWFMARCNAVWVAAGLPDMPGHGFRIGGATHLLLMGIPPDIVATQGRWKSRAFLEYWRKIESILPLFISSSGSSSRVSLIEDSMSSYRKKWGLK